MECRKDGQPVNLERKCVAPQEGEKICGGWKLLNGAWLPATTVCSIAPSHRTVFDVISSSTSGSLSVVPLNLYSLGILNTTPEDCIATLCPAGCCGQDGWFCCPDNINCAALPELCPNILDASDSYETPSGITIEFSNVFDEEVPVMLYDGTTGDMVSVPPGYNYAIFFQDNGNVTMEFVEEGQLLQFRSAIAIGQTNEPTKPFPNPSGRYPCDKFRTAPKLQGGLEREGYVIIDGRAPFAVEDEANRQGVTLNCENAGRLQFDARRWQKQDCEKRCKKDCRQKEHQGLIKIYVEWCNFCIEERLFEYVCCNENPCDDAAGALAKAKEKYGCTDSFQTEINQPKECGCYGSYPDPNGGKNPKKTCPPGFNLSEGWCEKVVGPGGESCCTNPPPPLRINGGPNEGQVCRCGVHLELNPEYRPPFLTPPQWVAPIEVSPGVWTPGYWLPGYWTYYDKDGNPTTPDNQPNPQAYFCNEEPDCSGPKEKYVWHPPECYPSLITCCTVGSNGQATSCAENVPYDQCTGLVSDLPCDAFCPVSSSSSSSSDRLDRTGAWCTGEIGCDGKFYTTGCAEGTIIAWQDGNANDTVQSFQEDRTCPGGGEDIECVVETLPECSSDSSNDRGAWCSGKLGCDGIFYVSYCEQGTLKDWQAKNEKDEVQNFNRGKNCAEIECVFEFLPECSSSSSKTSSSSSSGSGHFLWCNGASEQGGGCSFDPGEPDNRPWTHVWIQTNKFCDQAYCELCQGCNSCSGYHQQETTCGTTNSYKSSMEALGWECVSYEESTLFGTCNVAVNCCPPTSSSSS